ncbi:MAG: hypothetical protein ABIN79_12810 [Marmoricola sp.]
MEEGELEDEGGIAATDVRLDETLQEVGVRLHQKTRAEQWMPRASP